MAEKNIVIHAWHEVVDSEHLEKLITEGFSFSFSSSPRLVSDIDGKIVLSEPQTYLAYQVLPGMGTDHELRI